MASRRLLNFALLIAAVIAAVAVNVHEPKRTSDASDHRLVNVAQESIRTIEIQRINSTRILLQREGTEWSMRLPVTARLEETALARVLDLSRMTATTRLAADELSRYGLDQPWAKVRFAQDLLEFGNTNTVTGELYVKNGEAVYVVPARVATAIPGTPARLIAHRMLSADDEPVAVVMTGFSLRHDGTRWQLDPPNPGLSQDDLIRWIEQWRYASSVITQPGLTPSAKDAVVELRDGRKLEFSVKARTPDLVLHRHDESLDYHFNAGVASMLLTSPSATIPHNR